MKRTVLLLLPAVALSAEPRVYDVELVNGEQAGTVRVNYKLENPPAIITAAFNQGGERASWFMQGDVNTIVTNETGTFVYDVRAALTNFTGNLSCDVTAWTLAEPPRYCAINLSGGPLSETWPLEFYTSSNAVPQGVTDNMYKTRKILLRLVNGTGEDGFVMGSPEDESGRNPAREKQHTVILDHDYWLGVFPFTQDQYRRIKGTYGFFYTQNETPGVPYVPERPTENLSFWGMRGLPDDNGGNINWPMTTNAVSESSVSGILRAKTGGFYDWDIPTDAQWEWACRAGTTGRLNREGATLEQLAACNRGSSNKNCTESVGGTMRVGQFLPNAWGFYDMLGNVFEFVQDWRLQDNTAGGTVQRNPVGPAGSDGNPDAILGKEVYRIGRGGCFYQGRDQIRVAYRNANAPGQSYLNWGFRISATIGAKWDLSTTPPTLYK